jgi:hypothetical protein
MQSNDEIDQRRINQKNRKEFFEAAQPLIEGDPLEAHEERENDRRRSDNKIVQDNQDLTRRQFE